jgi:hypothetical protein
MPHFFDINMGLTAVQTLARDVLLKVYKCEKCGKEFPILAELFKISKHTGQLNHN